MFRNSNSFPNLLKRACFQYINQLLVFCYLKIAKTKCEDVSFGEKKKTMMYVLLLTNLGSTVFSAIRKPNPCVYILIHLSLEDSQLPFVCHLPLLAH